MLNRQRLGEDVIGYAHERGNGLDIAVGHRARYGGIVRCYITPANSVTVAVAGLPLTDAEAQLGVSRSTLKRWGKRGAAVG